MKPIEMLISNSVVAPTDEESSNRIAKELIWFRFLVKLIQQAILENACYVKITQQSMGLKALLCCRVGSINLENSEELEIPIGILIPEDFVGQIGEEFAAIPTEQLNKLGIKITRID